MAEGARKRSVAIGVWKGGGPPPGYEWTVLIHRFAFEEAVLFLDDDQYEYVKRQVQDLARHRDPTHSSTLSIDRVESFAELRMKGGGIGTRINARLYFDLVPDIRVIRVLGFDLKKNDGQILIPVKERILRRQRGWDNGKYPMLTDADS